MLTTATCNMINSGWWIYSLSQTKWQVFEDIRLYYVFKHSICEGHRWQTVTHTHTHAWTGKLHSWKSVLDRVYFPLSLSHLVWLYIHRYVTETEAIQHRQCVKSTHNQQHKNPPQHHQHPFPPPTHSIPEFAEKVKERNWQNEIIMFMHRIWCVMPTHNLTFNNVQCFLYYV